MSKQMPHHAGHRLASADYRVPARAGYALILVAFGVCGFWAARAPLNSAAVAQGQIEVDSRRKPIQHLEGGIIKEILIKEAQIVQKDQVLFRLEPTPARANSDMLRKQLDAALAQEARLLAELDGRPVISFPHEILDRRMIPDTVSAISNEERQFDERRQSIENQVRVFEARIEQTAHEITGRDRQRVALLAQIESITAQIASVGTLVEKGWYPRNRVLEQEREKVRLVGELGRAAADIARLDKQQDEARAQIEQIRQKFREDAAGGLADARVRVSDLREKVTIVGDILTRIDIRAPMTGVVQNLRVNGAGAVVKAGDTIAELIPIAEELVVVAQVSPLDIDSVVAGQKAEIRFGSLSRRNAPTVFGRVESISADALLNDSNKQSYYLARVIIPQADVPAAVATKLTPGMPADVLSRDRRTHNAELFDRAIGQYALEGHAGRIVFVTRKSAGPHRSNYASSRIPGTCSTEPKNCFSKPNLWGSVNAQPWKVLAGLTARDVEFHCRSRKSHPGGSRLKENQGNLLNDACHPPSACDVGRLICSNRGGSWKSRTSFFVTSSTSPSGVHHTVCSCMAVIAP